MSSLKTTELQNRWFPASGSPLETRLNSVFDMIGFTDAYVRTRIAETARAEAGGPTKVIKDNVWGMIVADPATMALIDTPLVQRLRRIHQLGLTYLTYPSGDHSRFTHSLGVFHVVGRFLQAMNDESSWPALSPTLKRAFPTQSDATDLLHAALLHDIGHLPFSHVVERILKNSVESFTCAGAPLRDFIFAPAETLAKETSLSETLSIALVLSPRFREFYTKAVRPGSPDAPQRIAALIAGFRLSLDQRALPDLISSGLDADKIDYLCRDASACGIPLGIDFARVFLRSMFVTVPYDEIPEALRHKDDPSGRPITVFVVNASGIDTIEELSFARASMYERVYLHQTTRNAERVLGAALTDAATNAPATSREHFKDVLDLWATDDFALLRRLASEGGAVASELGFALLNRRLPKRAGVFGPRFAEPVVDLAELFSSIEQDHVRSLARLTTGAIVDNLKENKLRGAALPRLEREIADEAVRLRDLISEDFKDLPTGRPGFLSVLPLPNLDDTKTSDVFVLERDGSLACSRDYSTSSELVDAAELQKGIGYLHGPPEWRELLFIAMRSVLYKMDATPSERRESLKLSKDAVEKPVILMPRLRLDAARASRRAKLHWQRVREFMNALAKHGEYDNVPALGPIEDEITREIDELAKPFANFSGQHGWRVTPRGLKSFLDQFPPRLRDDARGLVKQIRFLDRGEIAAKLQSALKVMKPRLPAGRHYVASLSPNSGAFVRMILEQEYRKALEAEGWILRKDLEEVLGESAVGDSVVLVDDNASSGSQASCQFRAWLGNPRDQWPERMRRERGIVDSKLEPNKRATLVGMSVGVAVCAGAAAVERNLREVLSSIGISRFVGVTFGLDLASEARAELSPALEKFLSAVGQAVLESDRDSTTGASATEDALGYGGIRGMVVTALSVPSSTLTALWCPGLRGREPWVPLFVRRGYVSRLVIA